MVLSKLIGGPHTLYLIGGVTLISAFCGWKVRDWQCDAAVAKAQRVVIQKTQKATEAVNAASAVYETQREALSNEATKDRTVIRTVYRTIKSTNDCAAPDPVVGVLDSATDRANAAAAGKPVSALPGAAQATPPAR